MKIEHMNIIEDIANRVGVIDPTLTRDTETITDATFPIDLLPEWLQTTIREHAESYGTPQELWAVAFLSGIAAASGKRMFLTVGNYRNYPQLWIIIVGASGTGKSDAGRVAFRRLSEIDADNYLRFQEEYKDWESDEKQGRPPRWAQSIIGDTTPEALFNVLGHADNGLTLYRDELSGWFSDFGRYNKSGEIGHYLSIFDNQTFSINRKKDQPQLITEPFLNIFGTIQPGVLSELLTKNNFEQSGFAQRFMFLYPEFPVRKYKRDPKKPSITLYENVIDKIVEYSGTDEMFLSDAAENVYEEFFNSMEDEKTRSNDFWDAVFAKAQIQVLRLALTVKIARLIYEPDTEVSETDMLAAIGMMRYFIASLQKFKVQQREGVSTKKDLILKIFAENPEANQTQVAAMVGVTREYVNKTVRSSHITGHTPIESNPTAGLN
jgi:hypothetical protein